MKTRPDPYSSQRPTPASLTVERKPSALERARWAWRGSDYVDTLCNMIAAPRLRRCVTIAVVSPKDLSQGSAPLLKVVEAGAPDFPIGLFAFITMFAVANSALINMLMASRLLYGMANERVLPRVLGKVHRTRRAFETDKVKGDWSKVRVLYAAVRDEDGTYLGAAELVEDFTGVRQRFLDEG